MFPFLKILVGNLNMFIACVIIRRMFSWRYYVAVYEWRLEIELVPFEVSRCYDFVRDRSTSTATVLLYFRGLHWAAFDSNRQFHFKWKVTRIASETVKPSSSSSFSSVLWFVELQMNMVWNTFARWLAMTLTLAYASYDKLNCKIDFCWTHFQLSLKFWLLFNRIWFIL